MHIIASLTLAGSARSLVIESTQDETHFSQYSTRTAQEIRTQRNTHNDQNTTERGLGDNIHPVMVGITGNEV